MKKMMMVKARVADKNQCLAYYTNEDQATHRFYISHYANTILIYFIIIIIIIILF